MRTHLDLLHPDLAKRVEEKQNSQKVNHDKTQRERLYQEGDPVYAKNFRPGDKWLPGKISQVLGTRTYMVELETGQVVKRHIDQLEK